MEPAKYRETKSQGLPSRALPKIGRAPKHILLDQIRELINIAAIYPP
jgi:hypothetical protein